MRTMLLRCALMAAVVLTAGIPGQADADTIVYATMSADFTSNSTLGTLDLTTGQFTAIATLGEALVSLTAGPGGTLYGGAINDGLFAITTGGASTPFGSVTTPAGFWGLADAGAAGFYAADPSVTPIALDKIAPDGNSLSTIGSIPYTGGLYGSGMLAFGPDGFLYSDQLNAAGALQLYRIDPATGVATAVGSGLATFNNDNLTLVTAGGQLYGIDTIETSGSGPINIYTIDTATGVATATGAVVAGLPTGYTLDTAAAVPEPSTLTLALAGLAAGLGVLRHRRGGEGARAE